MKTLIYFFAFDMVQKCYMVLLSLSGFVIYGCLKMPRNFMNKVSEIGFVQFMLSS